MKQGSTFVLIVNLNVDLSRINSVIFTLKNKDVTLTKENWTYNNGKFELPFTQEETVQLQGRTRIEAQINFADGNVAKTQIKDIYIQETLATRIIEDNIATQEGREVELLVEEDVIFTSEDYSKLANKPKINGVVLLGDVSLDSLNIASKEYVEEEIAKFDFIKVVDVLPEVGLPNRVYYVPKTNGGKNDLFDEYAWINGDWEYYGTKVIEVDLTEYVKKTDYATTAGKAGIMAVSPNSFDVVVINGVPTLYLTDTSLYNIDARVNNRPINCSNYDYAVKKALSDCKLADDDVWTDEEKAKALELLGGLQKIVSADSLQRVYAIGQDGVEKTLKASENPFANALVLFGAGGIVKVGTPTADNHATTKKYVDDLVGSVESILTELHSHAESLIGGES